MRLPEPTEIPLAAVTAADDVEILTLDARDLTPQAAVTLLAQVDSVQEDWRRRLASQLPGIEPPRSEPRHQIASARAALAAAVTEFASSAGGRGAVLAHLGSLCDRYNARNLLATNFDLDGQRSAERMRQFRRSYLNYLDGSDDPRRLITATPHLTGAVLDRAHTNAATRRVAAFADQLVAEKVWASTAAVRGGYPMPAGFRERARRLQNDPMGFVELLRTSDDASDAERGDELHVLFGVLCEQAAQDLEDFRARVGEYGLIIETDKARRAWRPMVESDFGNLSDSNGEERAQLRLSESVNATALLLRDMRATGATSLVFRPIVARAAQLIEEVPVLRDYDRTLRRREQLDDDLGVVLRNAFTGSRDGMSAAHRAAPAVGRVTSMADPGITGAESAEALAASVGMAAARAGLSLAQHQIVTPALTQSRAEQEDPGSWRYRDEVGPYGGAVHDDNVAYLPASGRARFSPPLPDLPVLSHDSGVKKPLGEVPSDHRGGHRGCPAGLRTTDAPPPVARLWRYDAKVAALAYQWPKRLPSQRLPVLPAALAAAIVDRDLTDVELRLPGLAAEVRNHAGVGVNLQLHDAALLQTARWEHRPGAFRMTTAEDPAASGAVDGEPDVIVWVPHGVRLRVVGAKTLELDWAGRVDLRLPAGSVTRANHAISGRVELASGADAMVRSGYEPIRVAFLPDAESARLGVRIGQETEPRLPHVAGPGGITVVPDSGLIPPLSQLAGYLTGEAERADRIKTVPRLPAIPKEWESRELDFATLPDRPDQPDVPPPASPVKWRRGMGDAIP